MRVGGEFVAKKYFFFNEISALSVPFWLGNVTIRMTAVRRGL